MSQRSESLLPRGSGRRRGPHPQTTNPRTTSSPRTIIPAGAVTESVEATGSAADAITGVHAARGPAAIYGTTGHVEAVDDVTNAVTGIRVGNGSSARIDGRTGKITGHNIAGAVTGIVQTQGMRRAVQ